MKDDLKKEILKYTAAAGAVLGAHVADAQNLYTNIADTTVSTNLGFYNLDLDQDGTIDFKITQYINSGPDSNTNAVIISPYNATCFVAGKKIGSYNYPFKLQAATIVDETTDFTGVGGNFNTGYMTFVVDGQNYPNSNWVGPQYDGYLGLGLSKNNRAHFGWARINIGPNSESFTVKDFAINQEPDSAIVVGQELLSTQEMLLQDIHFVVKDNTLFVDLPSTLGKTQISVRDVSGRQIFAASIQQAHAEFNLGEMPTGLYVVTFVADVATRSDKVFVF